MESGFGYEVRRVRIHTSEADARLAESLDSLAYTVGNNLVFGKSTISAKYNSGKKLLAHELMHAIK